MDRRRTPIAASPFALAAVIMALFAVPAVAKAPVYQLGAPNGLPAASCTGTPFNDRAPGPDPKKPRGLGRCSVLTMTTFFPTKDGSVSNPTLVPTSARIVAVTLRLGVLKDSKKCLATAVRLVSVKKGKKTVKVRKRVCTSYDVFNEKTYFETHFGKGSIARVAVLRQVKKTKGSKAVTPLKLVQLGPPLYLDRWFGRTVTFPLDSSIGASKGDIIGLSVPTYAPILPITGASSGDRWRSSRPGNFVPVDSQGKPVKIDPDTRKPPDPCAVKWKVIFKQTALTTVNGIADFRCSYSGVPAVQFTLVPTPTL